MTRKQAKRRSRKKTTARRLPALPWRRMAAWSVIVSVGLLGYHTGLALLDRPIRSITIEGPFQRVSALQIEESIGDELGRGFVSADLSLIRQRVVALPWIDQANVARRWPNRLEISVTEQVPAACWGESGLLNTRGELFVTDARHVPAELPRLSGPEDQARAVAQRYLKIREQLLPIGLDVRQLQVDARGAWDMVLQNGIEIRLGRKEVEARTQLFLDVVTDIVSSREAEIEFVDMRYSNGFTIGWKDDAGTPLEEPAPRTPEMLARQID